MRSVHSFAAMTTTTARRLTTVMLLSGAAWAALSSLDEPAPGPVDLGSERAVTALVEQPGSHALQAIPSSFEQVEGYRPQVEDGMLLKPMGSCSGPVPLPSGFDDACKQHDLGYDLLRHAHKTDGALPASARRSIDDQFERSMRATCDERTNAVSRGVCDGLAEAAVTSVRINSWRQHGSTPGHENALSIAAGGAAVLTLGTGLGLA